MKRLVILIRDRDGAFGPIYTHRIRVMGIRDHPTAPRSPWQNGYVERLIGSIRREASITSSYSTKRSCVVARRTTLPIIPKSELISHWRRARQIFGVSASAAPSHQYQSSADFIINTSGFRF
jgi:transposase InsO family protein